MNLPFGSRGIQVGLEYPLFLRRAIKACNKGVENELRFPILTLMWRFPAKRAGAVEFNVWTTHGGG